MERRMGYLHAFIHGPLDDGSFEYLEQETMVDGLDHDNNMSSYLDEFVGEFYIQDDLKELIKDYGVHELYAEVWHNPTVFHGPDGTEYDDMSFLVNPKVKKLSKEDEEIFLREPKTISREEIVKKMVVTFNTAKNDLKYDDQKSMDRALETYEETINFEDWEA